MTSKLESARHLRIKVLPSADQTYNDIEAMIFQYKKETNSTVYSLLNEKHSMIKEFKGTIQDIDAQLDEYDKTVETYISQLHKLKKNIDSIEQINNRMFNERKNKNDLIELINKLQSKYTLKSEEEEISLLDCDISTNEGMKNAIKTLNRLRDIFCEDTVYILNKKNWESLDFIKDCLKKSESLVKTFITKISSDLQKVMSYTGPVILATEFILFYESRKDLFAALKEACNKELWDSYLQSYSVNIGSIFMQMVESNINNIKKRINLLLSVKLTSGFNFITYNYPQKEQKPELYKFIYMNFFIDMGTLMDNIEDFLMKYLINSNDTAVSEFMAQCCETFAQESILLAGELLQFSPFMAFAFKNAANIISESAKLGYMGYKVIDKYNELIGPLSKTEFISSYFKKQIAIIDETLNKLLMQFMDAQTLILEKVECNTRRAGVLAPIKSFNVIILLEICCFNL